MVAGRPGAMVGTETEKEPEEPEEPGDSAPLMEGDGVVTLAQSPRVPALTPVVGVGHLAVVELTKTGGGVPGA